MNTESCMQIVSKRVRFLRDTRGWTQDYLARKAQVAQKTISNIEHGGGEGRDTLKLKNLEKIAKAFGFELWVFLIPDDEFIRNPIVSKQLGDLISFYLQSTVEGKQDICKVAEVVAKYSK